MAENGRMNKTTAIMNAFNRIMLAHKGIVLCEVTTAKVPLLEPWAHKLSLVRLDEANICEALCMCAICDDVSQFNHSLFPYA